MDAHKLWMLRDVIGENKVLFKIPVYQRNYDWSEENCNRLLDDVYSILDSGDKHFLGAVVFMSPKGGGLALREFVIIDGQQRLTSLMILLKALSDVARAGGDECWHEIEEQYLHNKYCDEAYKIKLKPIKSDSEQFSLLVDGRIDEVDEQTHIYRNYQLCKERFEQWGTRGIFPSQILDALTRLEIVEIALTQGEDDPQIIFESINSTGLELSNADLIRNYLLMNAENQEQLYEGYWLVIEKALRNKTDYSNLESFFMHYIVYKTGKPVNSRRIYQNFVKLFKDSGKSHDEILKELKYYAEIFRAFIYGSKNYPEEINRLLKKIRILNQTTCYPFLFHVFDDFNQGVIDEECVRKVLLFILSYLLRRTVCGVPSNTLRTLFTYLYNRVFKISANKRKYYEALNKFFFTLTSRDTIPAAQEFEKSLQHSNIYGNSSLCRFLLLDIENGAGKETLRVENLTIEHIMPQVLSADWSHIKSEEHGEYLHTLGNLSVTGYNSELSNKSFLEKRDLIRENSKAVILNSDVWDRDQWRISDIQSRAKRLSDIILNRYRIDRVEDNTIEFEYVETMTLDNYDEVTGKKLVSFNLLGETYWQNKFIPMAIDVCRILDRKQPGKLSELAQSNFSLNKNKSKRIYLNIDGAGMRNPAKIVDGVFLETNLSAHSCIRFIEGVLDQFGVDKDQFSFKIIAEELDELEEGAE